MSKGKETKKYIYMDLDLESNTLVTTHTFNMFSKLVRVEEGTNPKYIDLLNYIFFTYRGYLYLGLSINNESRNNDGDLINKYVNTDRYGHIQIHISGKQLRELIDFTELSKVDGSADKKYHTRDYVNKVLSEMMNLYSKTCLVLLDKNRKLITNLFFNIQILDKNKETFVFNKHCGEEDTLELKDKEVVDEIIFTINDEAMEKFFPMDNDPNYKDGNYGELPLLYSMEQRSSMKKLFYMFICKNKELMYNGTTLHYTVYKLKEELGQEDNKNFLRDLDRCVKSINKSFYFDKTLYINKEIYPPVSKKAIYFIDLYFK